MKRVLVACEESQVVTIELRKLGIEAYSCDMQPCSGGHPNWHIQADVIRIMQDDIWDMVIAFPPCTHIAIIGRAWFEQKRADGRQQQGIDFFMEFTRLDCPLVAIENPISIMSTVYRQPHQIIHPWQFGHGHAKPTCLWLKGLPLLQPTDIVSGRFNFVNSLSPSPNRAKIRSKTYPGIAKAMAQQWGKFLIGELDYILF